jgi:hypothetical protein
VGLGEICRGAQTRHGKNEKQKTSVGADRKRIVSDKSCIPHWLSRLSILHAVELFVEDRIRQEGNESRCRGYGPCPNWGAKPKPVAKLIES